MADAPIVERRKVIIEYENRIPGDLGSRDDAAPQMDLATLQAIIIRTVSQLSSSRTPL